LEGSKNGLISGWESLTRRPHAPSPLFVVEVIPNNFFKFQPFLSKFHHNNKHSVDKFQQPRRSNPARCAFKSAAWNEHKNYHTLLSNHEKTTQMSFAQIEPFV
jgi:hypothetical protein